MDDERCVLILRILDPLGSDDGRQFCLCAENDVVFYLQPGGPETICVRWVSLSTCDTNSRRMP